MMTLTTPKIWSPTLDSSAKRNVWTAMKRGFACRCPNCGEGKMFRAFLKTPIIATSAARTLARIARTICRPIS